MRIAGTTMGIVITIMTTHMTITRMAAVVAVITIDAAHDSVFPSLQSLFPPHHR
jgi:hypothetical protein